MAGAVAALRAGVPVHLAAPAALVLAAWPSSAGRWAAGAAGERRTATALQGLEADGYEVLHDVRLPGRRWNLDHVLLGPAGVVVVDSKQWRRPVSVWRRWPGVVEEAVGWQIDAVATELRGRHGRPRVTVHAFVCVHGAPVRRHRLTGARWAPIGDTTHLRRWLARLPPSPVPAPSSRKVFESAA